MNTENLSSHKQGILKISEQFAQNHEAWIEKKQYFNQEDLRYLRFLIPEGLRILDLGCGLGDQLAELKPSYGVGIDLSSAILDIARKKHPSLHFIEGDVEEASVLAALEGPFDIILLSDTIGFLEDCQQTLEHLTKLCSPDTRVIISYYGRAWDPLLKIAASFNHLLPQSAHNYLTTFDMANLLGLSGFEVIKREWRQLLPKYSWGIGPIVNRYIATLPGIRRFCLRNYMVARFSPAALPALAKEPSASVIITCRNEKGNVEAAIQRLPRFCPDLEILFVEGHSKDGTLDEIHRVIKAYPKLDIKVIVQTGIGKGDAVRAGFEKASGDVLIILDGDLTTPPEDMPKFYQALVTGKGEFINGSRLVYPMENEAMQFLNYLANTVFSWLFSYLLNQNFSDTLCGTKVLYKRHYQKVADNRAYFGDFDPFGDFDLIFGASKLNLKVIEIPVRYKARTYGSTQISRFTHGWLLLQMVVFAYRKLKAF